MGFLDSARCRVKLEREFYTENEEYTTFEEFMEEEKEEVCDV